MSTGYVARQFCRRYPSLCIGRYARCPHLWNESFPVPSSVSQGEKVIASVLQKSSMSVQIDVPFTPAPSFRPYLILVTAFGMLIPVFFFGFMIFAITEGPGGALAVMAGIFALLAFAGGLWAYLYYGTVRYLLTTTEMTWGRGVLWRQTGIVPYNRITNVDIIQGPVMRLFGISNLRIQTAGYSANQLAEIKLQGIRDPEPLRAVIMDFVRSGHPVAAVTGAETGAAPASVSGTTPAGRTADAAVLTELREIGAVLKRIEEKMQ
jgi:membrane protein YdbS with pleckstrin-like domain